MEFRRTRFVRHAVLGGVAAIAAAGVWAAASVRRADAGAAYPRRIVSLNLCGDQLLMALADRAQIAGLTPNARDPQLSAAADLARSLPVLEGAAEEVLSVDPDLVIGMPGHRAGAMAVLRAQGYRNVSLAPAESYADIVASIRTVAAAVGHPARGEALIVAMDKDLAAIRPAGDGKVAAYYQRRGFLTGGGTLVDDLMVRAGLVNLATRLGKPAFSQMSLEQIVAADPDYLIVDAASETVTDQGTEMLHHPVLGDIPRIRIPQAWTVCGGPAYVKAARALTLAATQRR